MLYLILPPPLKKCTVKDLNYKDPFFAYFKEKYPEFENWFHKCSVLNRECWIYYDNQRNIGALLIYKIEEDPINSLPSLPQKR